MSQETIDKLEAIIEEISEIKNKVDNYTEYSFPLDLYLQPIAMHTRTLATAVDAQVEMIKGTK